MHFIVYLLVGVNGLLRLMTDASWPYLLIFLEQKYGIQSFSTIVSCFWYPQIIICICLPPFLGWVKSRPFLQAVSVLVSVVVYAVFAI